MAPFGRPIAALFFAVTLLGCEDKGVKDRGNDQGNRIAFNNRLDQVLLGPNFEVRIPADTFPSPGVLSYEAIPDVTDYSVFTTRDMVEIASYELRFENRSQALFAKAAGDMTVCFSYDSLFSESDVELYVREPNEGAAITDQSTITFEAGIGITSLACLTTTLVQGSFYGARDSNAQDGVKDTVDPNITAFSLAADATYSKTQAVAISYTASETLGSLCLQESSDVSACTWLTDVTDGQSFELSAGDGVKTVYFWGRDGAENVSKVSSDTIVLDLTAPSVPSALSAVPDKIVAGTFPLSWTASADANFASHTVKYCELDDCDTLCVGEASVDSNSYTVTDLEVGRGLYACVAGVDKAGNSSAFVPSSSKGTVIAHTTPRLTAVQTLTGAAEDTAFSLTYAALLAAANESDEDGQTPQFSIESVLAGTLTEGGSAITAGTSLLSSGETWTWTPAANTNGNIDAFTVKVYDGMVKSATAVTVTIAVTAVNDAPTLTSVSNFTGATEDTAYNITYAELIAAADEADIDSNDLRFRIMSVDSGTLKESNVTVNDGLTVMSTDGYLDWTPASNATGTLAAFKVQAYDGSANSGTDVQVMIEVGTVNDAPTLTTISNLTGGVEDNGYVVSHTALAAAADEADVEGDGISFLITAVDSGTLTENGTAVVAGTSLLSSGEDMIWTPAANATGTIGAFSVKAHDGNSASASAVAVQVVVADNDGDNTITGNSEDNTLVGGYGGDTLSGGDGNDVLYADDIAFTTSSVSGLEMWLDAHAFGLTKQVTSAVEDWYDRTTNDRDAVDASSGTSTDRPTYTTNAVGGRSAISFDGSDDILNIDDLNIHYDTSVFAVTEYLDQNTDYAFKPILAADCNPFPVTAVGCNGYGIGLRDGDTDELFGYLPDGVEWDSVSHSLAPTSDFMIFNFHKVDSTGALYKDGNQLTSSNVLSRAEAAFDTAYDLGGMAAQGGARLKGDLAEVMVFNGEISENDRQKITRLLSYKYGIALSGLSFGVDTLTGGDGADRFVWTNASHSGITSVTRDSVTDFSLTSGDRIDLSGYPYRFDIRETNGLSLSGQAQVAWATDGSGNTLVQLNWGDTPSTDHDILLTGINSASLTKDHFIFAAPYRDHTLSLSPYFYLQLGESSGTNANDASTNDRDGTYLGTEGSGNDYQLAVAGATYPNADTAVKFLADGAGVDMGNIMSAPTTGLSVAFWINFHDLTTVADANAIQGIVYKGTKAGDTVANLEWQVYWDAQTGQDDFRFSIHDTDDSTVGTAEIASFSSSVVATFWYHYVCVWTPGSPGTVKIYRNGVEVASTSTSISNLNSITNNLYVGGSNSDRDLTKASLDDVAVWNSALTAGQVFDLFNAERGYK